MGGGPKFFNLLPHYSLSLSFLFIIENKYAKRMILTKCQDLFSLKKKKSRLLGPYKV